MTRRLDPRRAEAESWSPLLMALSGMLLVYIWRVHSVVGVLGTLELPSVAVLSGVGFFLASPSSQRRLRERIGMPPIKLIGALMGLMLLSIPLSVHRGVSFDFLMGFLRTALLVGLVLGAIRGNEDIRRLFGVILAGAVMFAGLSLRAGSVGPSGRLAGLTFHDPNDLALHMVVTLPVAIFFVARSKSLLLRLASAAAIAFCLYVVILTGSRGGFLALVAVGGYVVAFYRALPLRTRMGALVGGVLVLGVAASGDYWDQMSTLLNPQDDYNWAGNSDGGRIEVWKRGVGYMLSNPFLGVGGGAFHVAEGTLSPLADRQNYGIGLKWSVAHNSFVQVGAELGVFALLAFCGMLWHSFKSGWSISQSGGGAKGAGLSDEAAIAETLVASLLGMLVGGLFLSQAWASMLYTIVALLAALTAIAAKKKVTLETAAARTARRPAVGRRHATAHARKGRAWSYSRETAR